jgi:hypothetical protein
MVNRPLRLQTADRRRLVREPGATESAQLPEKPVSCGRMSSFGRPLLMCFHRL